MIIKIQISEEGKERIHDNTVKTAKRDKEK